MNIIEPQFVRVEVVADLPVLWATLQRLDLPATLDRLFPPPRLWKGPLTPGEVLSVWLLFVLSEGDHCLNHVEPWAAQHQGVLSTLLGKPVLPVDLQDDRLADWLTRLGGSDSFRDLERQLNQQTIRVYQLPTDTVRIDATTANSYADVVSEQGLLQFGHSKDDPTRPQLKIAAGVLDPLSMPLVTVVVPGNSTDDPLYIPIIQEVQQSFGRSGRTYVGDCKMAALATRAFVADGRDFYLCPLSENQLDRDERRALLQPVFAGTQPLQQVRRPGSEDDAEEVVAEGFSVDVEQTGKVGEKEVRWTERRWIVRSLAYAQAQEAALERRLEKAVAALRELVKRKQGKKQLYYAELSKAAEAIVARERVEGLLSYTVEARMKTRQVRTYGDRPARQETDVFFVIDVQRNETVIAEKKREMGWQVYATNALAMVLPQVVWAYRGQYRIENDWSRLKGRPLGLDPMYLQDETRMQGLVYLLSLGLRVLTLLEWVVRERLRKEGEKLQGVYAGQPGRKTASGRRAPVCPTSPSRGSRWTGAPTSSLPYRREPLIRTDRRITMFSIEITLGLSDVLLTGLRALDACRRLGIPDNSRLGIDCRYGLTTTVDEDFARAYFRNDTDIRVSHVILFGDLDKGDVTVPPTGSWSSRLTRDMHPDRIRDLWLLAYSRQTPDS